MKKSLIRRFNSQGDTTILEEGTSFSMQGVRLVGQGQVAVDAAYNIRDFGKPIIRVFREG